jgi:hypothetical protein
MHTSQVAELAQGIKFYCEGLGLTVKCRRSLPFD